MNVLIRGYLSGSFLLEREHKAWDAIVILDSKVTTSDFVAKHARRNLFLRFDDVSSEVRGKRLPTTDDVRAAIDFAANTQNLLVCCRAGQSRSAAIAFLISYARLGPDAAREVLDPTRHSPNPLIVELGSQVIGDPSVANTFTAWQAANRHVRLVDHLDEIERELDALERQGARNRITES